MIIIKCFVGEPAEGSLNFSIQYNYYTLISLILKIGQLKTNSSNNLNLIKSLKYLSIHF